MQTRERVHCARSVFPFIKKKKKKKKKSYLFLQKFIKLTHLSGLVSKDIVKLPKSFNIQTPNVKECESLPV